MPRKALFGSNRQSWHAGNAVYTSYTTAPRRSEDWQRFLYKASSGSVYAADMLAAANLAYMVDLTEDSNAPETLYEEDYAKIFTQNFPTLSPFETPQQLVDYAADKEWIPHPFYPSETNRNAPSIYQAIWSRRAPIDWTDLTNDAIRTCLDQWSPTFALSCIGHKGTCNYDSRITVSGMLFLSLTWPPPVTEK